MEDLKAVWYDCRALLVMGDPRAVISNRTAVGVIIRERVAVAEAMVAAETETEAAGILAETGIGEVAVVRKLGRGAALQPGLMLLQRWTGTDDGSALAASTRRTP